MSHKIIQFEVSLYEQEFDVPDGEHGVADVKLQDRQLLGTFTDGMVIDTDFVIQETGMDSVRQFVSSQVAEIVKHVYSPQSDS